MIDTENIKRIKKHKIGSGMNTSVFDCLTKELYKPDERGKTHKKKKKSKQWKKHERKEREKTKKKTEVKRKYDRVPKQYKVYIKSHWWEDRKKQYWQKFPKRCYRCFSTSYVQLHHIKYQWSLFGREPDESLIPMCHGCHELFHSIYGTKGNMENDMLDFENEYPFTSIK